MKKLTAILALVLLLGTASLAKAGVCVSFYSPGPHPFYSNHHVYGPPLVYHHWVPGRGWVVYHPFRRVLVWNRYRHCWL